MKILSVKTHGERGMCFRMRYLWFWERNIYWDGREIHGFGHPMLRTAGGDWVFIAKEDEFKAALHAQYPSWYELYCDKETQAQRVRNL